MHRNSKQAGRTYNRSWRSGSEYQIPTVVGNALQTPEQQGTRMCHKSAPLAPLSFSVAAAEASRQPLLMLLALPDT